MTTEFLNTLLDYIDARIAEWQLQRDHGLDVSYVRADRLRNKLRLIVEDLANEHHRLCVLNPST